MIYVWQMNDGRWHVSAETNSHPVYAWAVDKIAPRGFDTKAEADEAAKAARWQAARCNGFQRDAIKAARGWRVNLIGNGVELCRGHGANYRSRTVRTEMGLRAALAD